MIAIVRVSGREQGMKGVSLEEQTDQIARYCEKNGFPIPIPVEQVDDPVTAPSVQFTAIESATEKSTAMRVVWQRALEHADKGALFLCTRLDRFSRSTLAGLQALRHLRMHGARIVTLTENIDTSTPVGEMMFTQILSFAQLEASVIAERTSGGRRRLRRQGNYTEGPAPLGYRRGRRTAGGAGALVPVADEANVVFEAFKLCDEGLSSRNIADVFQARYPGLRRWSNYHVSSILRSRVYIGEIRSEARTGEWIKAHPPIIPEDLFFRVQAKLDEARSDKGRPPDPERYKSWLLHGLMSCGICGASIRSSHYYQSKRSKTHLPRRTTHTGYYVCYRDWSGRPRPCEQEWPFLKNNEVDARVAAEIAERLEKLAEVWSEVAAATAEKPPSKDFASERKRLHEKLQRIADGYAEATLSKVQARRLREEAEKELAKLDADERRAKAEREAIDPALAHASLLKSLPSLRELWAHGTPSEQREVTELLTEKIELFPNGDVRITYRDHRQVFKKLGFIGGGGLLDKTATGSGISDQLWSNATGVATNGSVGAKPLTADR